MNRSFRDVCILAGNPLLDYSCLTCYNFKRRDRGDSSHHHASDVTLNFFHFSELVIILLKFIGGTKKNIIVFSFQFQFIFSIFFSIFEKSSKSFPKACSSFMTNACLDDAGILLQKH